VREYEGVNPHTPKVIPTLGNGVPKLQRAISGVKTQWLVALFISFEKLLERRCLKRARIAHLDI
jgi:hypothetical protein